MKKRVYLDELEDGNYYELNNLFGLIGISNFYVNDRGYTSFDTRHYSEKTIITELIDANSDDNYPKRMYLEDPDFTIYPDTNFVEQKYSKYVKEKGLKRNIFSKDIMLKLILKYNESDNTFIEPLSNLKIRILNSNDLKSNGDATISYLQEETNNSINISPISILVDKYNPRFIPIIQSSCKEELMNSDNRKYADFFKYLKKESYKDFKVSLSKFKEIEQMFANLMSCINIGSSINDKVIVENEDGTVIKKK